MVSVEHKAKAEKISYVEISVYLPPRWTEPYLFGNSPALPRLLNRFIAQFEFVKYRVVIQTDEDGAFVATVPSLPGCVSQGKTRKDALKNIRDAIDGYLQSLKKHGEPIPPPIQEELVEVSA